MFWAPSRQFDDEKGPRFVAFKFCTGVSDANIRLDHGALASRLGVISVTMNLRESGY